MCSHQPRCPESTTAAAATARTVADRTDQGWSLLCNGVVLYVDGYAVLPDSHTVLATRADS